MHEKRDIAKAQHPRNTTLAVRPEPWFSARGRPKSDFRFGVGAKGLAFQSCFIEVSHSCGRRFDQSCSATLPFAESVVLLRCSFSSMSCCRLASQAGRAVSACQFIALLSTSCGPPASIPGSGALQPVLVVPLVCVSDRTGVERPYEGPLRRSLGIRRGEARPEHGAETSAR